MDQHILVLVGYTGMGAGGGLGSGPARLCNDRLRDCWTREVKMDHKPENLSMEPNCLLFLDPFNNIHSM